MSNQKDKPRKQKKNRRIGRMESMANKVRELPAISKFRRAARKFYRTNSKQERIVSVHSAKSSEYF